ncbi:MAG: hypothetical protein ERJ67_01655 [Aphanocapsa feldmannii 277cV]|uniref:DUF2518 family protein n=2 Tax=Aphanocapsa feldmannii TaxID=192050 RepID=A0A524RQM0_9CHRO|nr:MAG: hypothetical protein ERJ69_07240 [Aphanocapsa feldmannii 288cV]TGG94831.1 MAG: hypothetical protein ERJ67_01655 [Aphanocapsa feldmannii 277cV]TGH27521.1 MAG: hypothetical protein ERJ68_01105 [Aphanocapsa feldmannii 277cI]
MVSDPLLLKAGTWLGIAAAMVLLLTLVAFRAGWGVRFRLVGVSSFTALLAISCLAFAISYEPPVQVEGALSIPVVFDNGRDLIVASSPDPIPADAVEPSLRRLALVQARRRWDSQGVLTVRLRSIRSDGEGVSRPVVLATATIPAGAGPDAIRIEPG